MRTRKTTALMAGIFTLGLTASALTPSVASPSTPHRHPETQVWVPDMAVRKTFSRVRPNTIRSLDFHFYELGLISPSPSSPDDLPHDNDLVVTDRALIVRFIHALRTAEQVPRDPQDASAIPVPSVTIAFDPRFSSHHEMEVMFSEDYFGRRFRSALDALKRHQVNQVRAELPQADAVEKISLDGEMIVARQDIAAVLGSLRTIDVSAFAYGQEAQPFPVRLVLKDHRIVDFVLAPLNPRQVVPPSLPSVLWQHYLSDLKRHSM